MSDALVCRSDVVLDPAVWQSVTAEGTQQKNRELAIVMLNDGVPVEIITKLTGYSVEDLVRMKDQKETIVGP